MSRSGVAGKIKQRASLVSELLCWEMIPDRNDDVHVRRRRIFFPLFHHLFHHLYPFIFHLRRPVPNCPFRPNTFFPVELTFLLSFLWLRTPRRNPKKMLARNLDMMVFLCGVSLLLLLDKANAFAPMPIKQPRISQPGLFMSKSDSMTEEEREAALQKATKAMTAFTNKYLENTSTYLCSDSSVPAVVIKGLAEHKVSLGAPLCPCRFYDDKEAEAKDGYWNCPCVPMRERHECHCMLFLTEDNAFVGTSQVQ